MADFKSSKLGNCKIYLGMTLGDLGTFFPTKLKKANILIWNEANMQGLGPISATELDEENF